MLRTASILSYLLLASAQAQDLEGLTDHDLVGQERSPFEARAQYRALLKDNGFWQTVNYEVRDGHAITGGDIILGTHNVMQLETALNAISLLRSANASTVGDANVASLIDDIEGFFHDTTNEASLEVGRRPWPSRRVPYVIDNVGPQIEAYIEEAIDVWNHATNVEIVPADAGENEVLRFIDAPGHKWDCAAQLGYTKGFGGFIQLNPPCLPGTILHEIGHALGLMHEHSRPERNQFINIAAFASGILNYDITSYGLGTRTTYDVCSIMHYSSKQTPGRTEWFSLTELGRQSLQLCAKSMPPRCQFVGQRCIPSEGDITLINALYPE